jgi:hypothetical protein
MKITTESLQGLSQNIGMVLMTAAATLGMLELPEHPNAKVVISSQPAFSFATNVSNDEGSNLLRREKEETGAHYISYSTIQRTPGRTGKF